MSGQSAKLVSSDEEVAWYALLQRSRKLRDCGNEEDFVKTALSAFRRRPCRAEPLHDLARFYLTRSRGDLAAVYAAAGLPLPIPEGDRLGVESAVYDVGLKEAFTIAASYSKDQEEKERGRAICNWLALGRDVPKGVRDLARLNYHWYTESAHLLMPSIRFHPLIVDAPEGFKPGNISIAREGDGFVALIRAVNYDMLESGYFDRHGDTSFRQRTLFVRLNERLQVTSSVEVLPPEDLPAPLYSDSIGFEDPRPILWRGDYWCISSVRQLNSDGRAEMVLARISEPPQQQYVLTEWRVLASGMPVQWEKNWMPQVIGDELRFIYSLEPTRILSELGDVLQQDTPTIAVENVRGGSQAIPFDGGWLMVVHDWQVQRTRRHYFHRFVWFDEGNRLRRISRRFFFQRIASEFAAGLAWHVSGDRLVISFGVDDHEPTLATVDASDVAKALMDIEQHHAACGEAVASGWRLWDMLRDPNYRTSDGNSISSVCVSEHSPERHLAFSQKADGNTADTAIDPGFPYMKGITRILTTFGTMVYVDVESGELRHGQPGNCPDNALFQAHEGHGRILYQGLNGRQGISCHSDGSRLVEDRDTLETVRKATYFEIVEAGQGLKGLRSGGLFLSALPNGKVALSASVLDLWETYRLWVPVTDKNLDIVTVRQPGSVVNTRIQNRPIRFFVENPEDEIQKHHLRGAFQEIEELDIIGRYSTPGRTFVDVGCNVGNHSIYISKFLDYAKIIPFEPNPDAISVLRINLLLNQCANVDSRYLGIALGTVAGRGRIYQPYANNFGRASLVDDPAGGITIVSGDELLLTEDVSFIKIDVEGMEMDILEGLSRTIERWRPRIFIEVWPDREEAFSGWCDRFRYEVRCLVPHFWGRFNYTNYMITPR